MFPRLPCRKCSRRPGRGGGSVRRQRTFHQSVAHRQRRSSRPPSIPFAPPGWLCPGCRSCGDGVFRPSRRGAASVGWWARARPMISTCRGANRVGRRWMAPRGGKVRRGQAIGLYECNRRVTGPGAQRNRRRRPLESSDAWAIPGLFELLQCQFPIGPASW
jgi:hypothetical protein